MAPRSFPSGYFLRLASFALLSFAFLFGAAWTGLAYQVARSYAYPPEPRITPKETPQDYGTPYQEVVLITRDGLRLAAWYTPPQGTDVILLIGHGNGAHRMARVHSEAARYTGFGVLSWDFRSHGESEGDLRTFGLKEAQDVQAATAFARTQPGIDMVVAWGTSMGGAAALWAGAQDPTIQMVIADSVYADLAAIEANLIRLSLLRPLVRLFLMGMTGLRPQDLRPVDVVSHISPRPLMLIHGGQDAVIPLEQAQSLYEQARRPKLLWVWPQAGHSAAFSLNASLYWTCIRWVVEAYSANQLPTEGIFIGRHRCPAE